MELLLDYTRTIPKGVFAINKSSNIVK